MSFVGRARKGRGERRGGFKALGEGSKMAGKLMPEIHLHVQPSLVSGTFVSCCVMIIQ
jgi:hypothetical protein